MLVCGRSSRNVSTEDIDDSPMDLAASARFSASRIFRTSISKSWLFRRLASSSLDDISAISFFTASSFDLPFIISDRGDRRVAVSFYGRWRRRRRKRRRGKTLLLQEEGFEAIVFFSEAV
ncbi:hypothetical protein EVAR_56569_1 [Eumeta japonica]|uniref:Uncharacterized protein n=1 Tax=Eumeta variegata TaxID=151549 RepID=A0A4C1YWU2_EUMVA|nr:hypothetical protein EVAR_56569_1 [Eumeta japonica]